MLILAAFFAGCFVGAVLTFVAAVACAVRVHARQEAVRALCQAVSDIPVPAPKPGASDFRSAVAKPERMH